jgi:hypothetical protein
MLGRVSMVWSAPYLPSAWPMKLQEEPGARSVGTDSARACPIAWTIVGACLLAHAALVLADVVDLPLWVAVIECLVASLVGIHQLRRVTALGAVTDPSGSRPGPPIAGASAPQPWGPPKAGFPARMVPPAESLPGGDAAQR